MRESRWFGTARCQAFRVSRVALPSPTAPAYHLLTCRLSRRRLVPQDNTPQYPRDMTNPDLAACTYRLFIYSCRPITLWGDLLPMLRLSDVNVIILANSYS